MTHLISFIKLLLQPSKCHCVSVYPTSSYKSNYIQKCKITKTQREIVFHLLIRFLCDYGLYVYCFINNNIVKFNLNNTKSVKRKLLIQNNQFIYASHTLLNYVLTHPHLFFIKHTAESESLLIILIFANILKFY